MVQPELPSLSMEWLLWLLMLAPVAPPKSNYPPAGVILLQTGPEVPIRWSLPGRSYQLEVWQNSKRISMSTGPATSATVRVGADAPVSWKVSSERGQFESSFSVSQRAEYHADGSPGTQNSYISKGRAGGNADTIRVRLSRDQDGMHLVLWHRSSRLHYLFVTPGLRFKVTAEGGSGHPGIDGVDSFAPGQHNTPGTDGTDGGHGGRVVVSTGSAPWRDYLDISVRGGAGGRGGRGGRCYQADLEVPGSFSYPDRSSGRDGLPGKLETLIEDGW